MEAKYCAITVLFRFLPEKSSKKAKNAGFNGFFGLISFLKTDAVLDHLPESIKVKFVGSHNIKKQIPYPKIQVRPLRTILYKFNTEIGRHPAMPFIVMHFKGRNLRRPLCLFRSLSNPYDKSFPQK